MKIPVRSILASIVVGLMFVATTQAAEKLGLEPSIKEIKSSSASEFTITYKWKVTETPKADWRVFVHFTDDKGEIKFQDDHEASPGTSQWKPGDTTQGPNTVAVPDGMTGTFEIRMGLFNEASGDRAQLKGKDDGTARIAVGKIKVGDGKVEFIPAK